MKKNCIVCGKLFYTKNDKAKFCSHKCVGINQNKREKRKCLLCGKEFTVKQYRINKGYGKY